MRRECGFASVPVIVILAAFSTLAVALVQRSFGQLKTVRTEIVRQQAELTLISATSLALERYLQAESGLGNLEQESGDGVIVQVRLEDEQAKLNLLRAEIQEIDVLLTAAQFEEKVIIRDAFQRAREAFLKSLQAPRMSNLILDLDVSPQSRSCLRRLFTTYTATHNPLPLERRPTTRISQRAGAIIRVSAAQSPSHRRTTTLSYSIVVLITGEDQNPIWTLEKGFDYSAPGDCDNA